MTIPASDKIVGQSGHTTDHNAITTELANRVEITARPVHVRDHTVGGVVTKASIVAAFDAAETAGGSGEVHVTGMGRVDVTTGLSLSGYSSVITGSGASHATDPTGDIFWASTQTGPVLNLTGWVDPQNFRGRPKFSGFGLEGSNVADATKVKTGLYIDSLDSVSFENIVISRTGGPCIKASASTPGDALYLCSFTDVILVNPVNAGTNDVPWLHLIGSNANRFIGLGLYSRNTNPATADVGAGGAVRIEEDASFAPELNVFMACWTENLHLQTSAAVVHCQGNGHVFAHWQHEDLKRVSGVADTCVYRFSPTALQNYGGNVVEGLVPGWGGTATEVEYGVDLYQNHNVIRGVKGFNGNNVRIGSGVGRTTIDLAGGYSTVGNAAVVDNSGVTTNVITDNYLQKWQLGLGVLGPYSDGAGRSGLTVTESTDATGGTLALGNGGARVQALPSATTSIYTTADIHNFRNLAATLTPVQIVAAASNPGLRLFSVNGATFPAARIETAGGFIDFGSSKPRLCSGSGSPEGVVTGNIGSVYLQDNGAAGTTFWTKLTGSGNTGWSALPGLTSANTWTGNVGFYGTTAIARPSAYTQTYATADKTHANPTAAALTVTDGTGTNDGTIGAITADASVIAAVQELAAQIGKLVADQADTKQLINSVIDDLQALGLFQ